MPILQLSMRSQDLDGGNDVNNANLIAKKTFRLNKTFKMKYLKLLHVYTNISSANIIDGGDMANTIIFARISFLNDGHSVFYENTHLLDGSGNISGNTMESNGGFISLGKTIDHPNTIDFRDMYKLLHQDAKSPLYINQPFTIELYKLIDVADDTNGIGASGLTAGILQTYNKLDSHKIVPITQAEFRGNLDSAGQFLKLVFEYDDNDKK